MANIWRMLSVLALLGATPVAAQQSADAPAKINPVRPTVTLYYNARGQGKMLPKRPTIVKSWCTATALAALRASIILQGKCGDWFLTHILLTAFGKAPR